MGKSNKIIVLIFTIFIGVFFGLNIITPAKEFSDVENRYLEQMPEFSFDSLVEGEFTKDFEKYISDQFIGRDNWVAAKSFLERLSGKKENNDVYIGEDGTLINKFKEPNMVQVERNLAALKYFQDNFQGEFISMLVPSSAYIWADKLPSGAPNYNEHLLIDMAEQALGGDLIDPSEILLSHKDEYIYYKTDHHWTTLGAYYGYLAYCEKAGIKPMPMPEKEDWVGSFDNFYGTIFSSSGVRFIKPDTVDVMVKADNVKVEIDKGQGFEDGVVYDLSYADKKDKYSIFFGGNFPTVKITTGNEGDKLLVIKDSYANSFLPFLFNDYSEIHVVDLRNNKSNMLEYAKANGIDNALVLYSLSGFANDTNIPFLKQ